VAAEVSEGATCTRLWSLSMDGTLTVSNIDFKLMRERTGILEGDLFTVMGAPWSPGEVTAAHDIPGTRDGSQPPASPWSSSLAWRPCSVCSGSAAHKLALVTRTRLCQ